MLSDTRRNNITCHARHTTHHNMSQHVTSFLTVLSSKIGHVTRVTLYFSKYIYIYIYIYIYMYYFLRNMSATCVTCNILLENMQKHKNILWREVWRVVTCVTCRILDVKVSFREKRTWNLESHKLLSQVLASVRPVTVYCYW